MFVSSIFRPPELSKNPYLAVWLSAYPAFLRQNGIRRLCLNVRMGFGLIQIGKDDFNYRDFASLVFLGKTSSYAFP
jgi:hypothetical protein